VLDLGSNPSGSTILNKWNDYFKIVQVENLPRGGQSATSWMLEEYLSYEVRDPDDKLIGTYKDQKYAIKQAKYKFKRLQAKLEKILLA